MSEDEVQIVATPITALDLLVEIEEAWPEVFGEPADRETTLLLLAQSAFEDGWWRACWCFNLENAKHVDGDGKDFYFLSCTEYLKGQLTRLYPPDPGCRFLAFSTLAESVRDYLRLLQRRYPKSLAAAKTHNAVAFAQELHVERFYTDLVDHYTREIVGVLAMVRKIVASAPPPAAPLAPNPSGGRIIAIAEGVEPRPQRARRADPVPLRLRPRARRSDR